MASVLFACMILYGYSTCPPQNLPNFDLCFSGGMLECGRYVGIKYNNQDGILWESCGDRCELIKKKGECVRDEIKCKGQKYRKFSCRCY